MQPIRELRHALGVSLTRVASESGVPRSTVQFCETSDRPNPDTYALILEALDCIAAEQSERRQRLAKEMIANGAAILAQESLT